MRRIALIIAVVCSHALRAEGPSASELLAKQQHPIDVVIEAAFEKAGSTAAMNQAAEEARRLWDTELNRIYQSLKKKLSKDSWIFIQESQRAWVMHRDAEWKSLENIYASFDGTMYGPMCGMRKANIIRARVIGLQATLDAVNEFGQSGDQ